MYKLLSTYITTLCTVDKLCGETVYDLILRTKYPSIQNYDDVV